MSIFKKGFLYIIAVVKATDTQTHPSEDGDVAITTLEGPAGTVYVGYWYGSNIGVEEDGTTYYPVSGTVTLSNGTISMDLVCKATEAGVEGRPGSPASIHVTGGSDFTCSYLQDWSGANRVKTLSLNSPVPVD